MPKNRKSHPKNSDSEQESKSKKDTSDSDSGPEDRNPVKKAKTDEGSSKNHDNSWEIGRNRYTKLTEFKGKWYVDIREFYMANGDMRPGKKGIMLTMEQWRKFRAAVDEIDEAIKKNQPASDGAKTSTLLYIQFRNIQDLQLVRI